MPTPRKSPERRQNRSTRDTGNVSVLPAVAAVPEPDLAWREEVRSAWFEFWRDPVARLVRPNDLPALDRLFRYRNEWLDAAEFYEAEPIVEGSMGQSRLSPWADRMDRLEKQLVALEDRFGLTPLSRLRLGVTLSEGQSLAQRNAAFASRAGGGTADVRPTGGGVDGGEPGPR